MANKPNQQLTEQEIYEKGMAELKDLIAPSAMEINANFLKLGEKYTKTIFAFSYPRYLITGWLSPIINFDKAIDISLFFHPLDTAIVMKNLKKKIAQIQSQISEKEEKGMVRDPILETAAQDVEYLRNVLQTAQEKLFKFGLYITIYANSADELNKTSSELEHLMESRMIYVKNSQFQQDVGFNSTLPILKDELDVSNNMNSQPISTAFPFISFDLTSNKGILYGINRHNNSLIIFDRFSLENGNMVIFAKSGSGKSYTTKLEILRSLMIGTEIIVIDPENEYQYLAETMGGSYIKISLTSPHHINPFDVPIPKEDEDPENILRSQIINVVGLLKLMLGGLTPEEDAVLDRAVAETYYARDITPESDFTKIEAPLLGDLQAILDTMEGAKNIAERLRKYTAGSWSGFLNKPTNVTMVNKLVVFSIRDMEEELRPVAMYIILHYIWNAIRRELKKRILVVDEAWWMMKHEDAASFLFGIAKRCRKYYLGLTTITQDVNDFLSSTYGKPIVTNSSLQLLLKQSTASADVLKQTFNLTDEEKYLLIESNVGEGLFFAGLKHAAIKVIASYTEDQIITSDPAQLLAIQKAKKELEEAEKKAV